MAGQFTYDADTNVYSNVSVTAQGGTGAFDGPYYQPTVYNGEWESPYGSFEYHSPIESPSTGGVTLNAFQQCFGPCNSTLTLVYASALTNVGGVIALLPGYSNEQYCVGSLGGCLSDQPGGQYDGYRGIVSGTLTASVVPIPAAVWLFASGLGLLGWMRRRA